VAGNLFPLHPKKEGPAEKPWLNRAAVGPRKKRSKNVVEQPEIRLKHVRKKKGTSLR